MTIPELSRVALLRPLPEHRLRVGTLGTIVWVYQPGDPGSSYEIEFVDGDGATLAVATLSAADLRPV